MAIQARLEGLSTRTTESQWLDQSEANVPVASAISIGMKDSPSAANGYTSNALPTLVWDMRSSLRSVFEIDRAYMVLSPADLIPGEVFLDFTNATTGGFAPSWGSVFVWDGDIEPTFNTAPGAKNIYQFYCGSRELYGKLFYQTPLIS